MMTHELLELGVSALVLSSFWMLIVLAVRRPVSRWLGARWAYYLWVLPLVGLLAIFSPAQSAKLQLGVPDIEIPGVSLVIDGAVSAVSNLNAAYTAGPRSSANYTTLTAELSLLVLWLIGGLVSLVLLALRSVRFSRWVQRESRILSAEERSHVKALCKNLSKRVAATFRITACDSGPAVAGLFRPTLLLPNDFFKRYSRDQQALVLQHEHHHLRRHDLMWLSLARLYRCLFWFNPLVYVAERFLQLDQELSCDEKVLARQNHEARRNYGEMLLLSASTRAAIPHASYLPTFSQVKERTSMLKYHNHQTFSRLIGAFVVAASIVGSVAYGVGDSSDGDAKSAMSPEVYEHLSGVQKLIEADGVDEATYAAALDNLREFEEHEDGSPLTPYELAQVNNLSGYVNYLKGDYKQALVHYARIVELDHETLALHRLTLITMSQLQFTLSDYEQVVVTIERLEKTYEDGPPPAVWMLKGQSYYQLQQYEPASLYINLAIDQVESKGLVPKKNWVQLQRASEGTLSGAEISQFNLDMRIAEGDYQQLVKVGPIYPHRALSRGIEGFCVIEYTVTKQGTVRDPRVIESQCTNSLFYQASLQAALKFKYNPRVLDGEAIDVPGVQNQFNYEITE